MAASGLRREALDFDGCEVLPHDEAELARLAAQGLTPETDPIVMVAGPGPRLRFHLRQGARAARVRMHLDVSTPDRRAEVARLVALGTTFAREGEGHAA